MNAARCGLWAWRHNKVTHGAKRNERFRLAAAAGTCRRPCGTNERMVCARANGLRKAEGMYYRHID